MIGPSLLRFVTTRRSLQRTLKNLQSAKSRSIMLNDERALVPTSSRNLEQDKEDHDQLLQRDESPTPRVRDIHALTLPHAAASNGHAWETSSHRSSSLSSENFTTMSREFSALVLAGSTIGGTEHDSGSNNLGRIREEENSQEEINPLAIVPDTNPLQSARANHTTGIGGGGGGGGMVTSARNGNHGGVEVSVQSVKKEEVESKISAWQNAKIAKINNRFKRDDAIINSWEGEQVQKATSWMKKIERKLEEKRVKAYEKMQNDIAKANRKAEERRASAEAKRGTKVAKVLDLSNLMRAVGRPPVKRSFF